MKNAALISLLFVAFGLTADAQRLTLLPQAGFENTRTSLSFNDLATFSPLDMNFSPQAGLRLDYKFKQGFGPYLGISTARTRVNFNFADAETAMNDFTAVAGDMQLRFESGFQYSFKPLSLAKAKSSSSKSQANSTTKTHSAPSTYKGNCARKYESYSSRCSGKKAPEQTAAKKKSKGSWVSIQPSLGFAYVPSSKAPVITKTQGGQTTYQYLAGNKNAALVAGTGFEFGTGSTRKFTLTLSYQADLGNLNEQTITTVTGNKTSTTTLASGVSGWNLKVGIPFTLTKKKQEVKQKEEVKKHHEYKGKCGQYRIIYQYKRTI